MGIKRISVINWRPESCTSARRLDRPKDGARRQDGERGFDRFTHDFCPSWCKVMAHQDDWANQDDWTMNKRARPRPATWSRATISTVMQAMLERGDAYGRRSALAARRSRISLR